MFWKRHKNAQKNELRNEEGQVYEMNTKRFRENSFLVNVIHQYVRNEFGSTVPSFLELWMHVAFLIIVSIISIAFGVMLVYLLGLYGPDVYYAHPVIGNIVLAFLWLISVSYIYACEAAKELKYPNIYHFASART